MSSWLSFVFCTIGPVTFVIFLQFTARPSVLRLKKQPQITLAINPPWKKNGLFSSSRGHLHINRCSLPRKLTADYFSNTVEQPPRLSVAYWLHNNNFSLLCTKISLPTWRIVPKPTKTLQIHIKKHRTDANRSPIDLIIFLRQLATFITSSGAYSVIIRQPRIFSTKSWLYKHQK
jgi:hypothetical protein